MKLNLENKRKVWGFAFVLPALIFFGIFSTYPLLNAFFVSFFEYDLLTPKIFIGFSNYIELFNSMLFRKYLFVTLYYVIGTCGIIWVVSFSLALLLKRKFLLRDFFRSIFFMPTVMSLIVVSIIWKVMLQYSGPINSIIGQHISWLTSTKFAMPAMIMLSVWKGSGYYMILFLAGLQSIPGVYYEAAQIDGANKWQLLRNITIPLLKPTIVFVIIISIITGLKVFEPMYIMTSGGPDDATKVLTLAIYQTGFRFFEMGKASAMSIIMFVIIMVFTILQLRLFRSEGENL